MPHLWLRATSRDGLIAEEKCSSFSLSIVIAQRNPSLLDFWGGFSKNGVANNLGVDQVPQSPNFPPPATVTTPVASKGSSLPPGFRPPGRVQQQQYTASPLQNALTPPPPEFMVPNDSDPFPSVESFPESAGSGQDFQISRSGLPTSASTHEDSSPVQHDTQRYPVSHSQNSSMGSKADTLEIFCASCGRPRLLRSSFACTECISGVCSDCVGPIIASPVVTVQPGSAPVRRGCPRCGVMGGKWKRFQLDFR